MAEEYEVEKIIEKKLVYRPGSDEFMPYYLIKWRGFPDSDNSWEPLTNLSGCSSALRRFELKGYHKFIDNPSDPSNIYVNVKENLQDFDEPRVPEKVLGAYNLKETDQKFYLLKWKNRKEPSILTYEEARDQYPQFMIDFYESNIALNHVSDGSHLNLIKEGRETKSIQTTFGKFLCPMHR